MGNETDEGDETERHIRLEGGPGLSELGTENPTLGMLSQGRSVVWVPHLDRRRNLSK